MTKQWFEGDVVTNGVRLHYYRTGGDKPPVALSHGITDNGMGWLRVAQALEKDYDVIMVDARGHGRSEKPSSGYAYQNMAVDLAGLLRELSINKPAVMGHSMGSHISMILAATRPEAPACLILEDPAFRLVPFTVEQGLAASRKAPARFADYRSRTREQLKEMGRRESPGMLETELEHWADSLHQVSLDVYNEQDAIRSYSYTPWQELVARITCPILLITGDSALGALTPPEGAELATRIWKSGTVAHFAGCGHVIRRCNFDGYISVLKDWLRVHYPA
jgi:pimeloyl-ACP methyl ester carboxylesterase